MRTILTSTAILLTTATLASADAAEICLFEEEDWSATLAACTEALGNSTSDQERGRFILHRGVAQDKLGNPAAARLDYILATNYRPDWASAYINAAGASEDLGEPDQQLRWALAAIEAAPDEAIAYSELLYIRNNDDDDTSCGPVADQLLEVLEDPIDWPFAFEAHPNMMGNLGYCLWSLDRPQEALQVYLAADYMGLDELWFLEDFAYLAYAGLEQDERAIELATRALSHEDGPSLDALYTLVWANIYLEQNDGAFAAVETYPDLLNADDQSNGIRNAVAWHLFLTNDTERASQVIEQWVASLGPDHQTPDDDIASTWDTAAHIRAALGDADGALEAFRMTLSLNTDEFDERRPETYRRELEALGFSVAEGEDGLIAGLAECVATGAACRLFFEDDAAAQAAQAADE